MIEAINTPTVTVIMAAYATSQEFFAESVTSVLAQTLTDFEFIIVDDGLSQENRCYLTDIDDSRLRVVVNEQNMGQSRSVNRALPLARGEYIARMDSDDVMTPTRLEVQVRYMTERPDNIACGGLAETTDTHRVIPGHYPDAASLRAGLFFACDMVHPTMMLRRSAVERFNLRYDEEQLYAQDYMMWTDLLACGEVGMVEEVVLNYRVHEGQISSNKREAQDMYAARAQKKYFENHGFDVEAIDFELHGRFAREGLAGDLSVYNAHLEGLLDQAREVLSAEESACFERELSFRAFKAGARELVRGGRRSNGLALLLRYGMRIKYWPYYKSRVKHQ